MLKFFTTISTIIYCLFISLYCYGGYSVSKQPQLYENSKSVPEKNWHNAYASVILSQNIEDSTDTQTKETRPKRAKEENWEAATSIVLGTAGWILSLTTGAFWIYFFFSIPAIVFGIKGLKRHKKRKYIAVLGLIIGLSLGLILFAVGLQIFPELMLLFN